MWHAWRVSTTRMMILGLVRMMQPVHGYDVRRELLSWQADKWANVQPGSIYHALRKLTEEGLLREVEHRARSAAGRRAPATRSPTKGSRRVRDAPARAVVERQADDRSVRRGVLVPAGAAARGGGRRRCATGRRLLPASVESLRASIASAWISDYKPTHVAWMFELGIARMEGEIAWCERVADLVESGVSYLPDTLRESPEFRAAIDGDEPRIEQ